MFRVAAPPVPQLGPSTEDDGNHIISNGQSLSVGGDGDPALTTVQPFDGLRANGTGFDSLVEATVETHVSAMINQLRTDAGASREWIGSTHGGGGTPFDPDQMPDGLRYEAAITQVTQSFANRASLTDGNYRVVMGVMIQGEQDVVLGTDADDYLADMLVHRPAFESEVQSITGQTEPVPWIVWQVSSAQRQSSANSADSRERSLIANAQWRASIEQPNRWFTAGPKYWVFHDDGTHLPNTGYRLMGEYTGMIANAILVDGIAWRPVSPETIVATGSNIRVCYHVPCSLMGTCDAGPVLAIDTTNVTCPELTTGDATCRAGFELFDPNPDPRYITAVAVDGNTPCIDITTNDDVQTGSYLSYAWTGALTAYGGPGTGNSYGAARGNVRDTNTIVGYDTGTTLHNWGVHMGPQAISGGVAPGSSVATLIDDKVWTWAWVNTDAECPAAASIFTSAAFAKDPQNVGYGAGTWTCDTATHVDIDPATIGSARVDEALDPNDTTPGCWRTSGTGNSQWDIAANEDIHIRYIGVIGRNGNNYYLTGFTGDTAAENQFWIRINNAGSITYTFNTGGANNVATVASTVPATPTWAVVDFLLEKQGGNPTTDFCRATLCVNGSCASNSASGPCGATGTGNLGISGLGSSCVASTTNTYPWVFLGYAIGEQARNGWRLSTDDFASDPWRMSAIDTEHESFCTAGLGSCTE